MRHGCLLAEENPVRLMTAYNLTTLEEVFLKLCAKQRDQVSSTVKIDCLNEITDIHYVLCYSSMKCRLIFFLNY